MLTEEHTTKVGDTKVTAATQNACKLCAPLGASLVFKGVENAVPLLHGSQGCATYIRRYLISHYKEPVDIACSNFSEHTAVFGGGVNLRTALANIQAQYDPAVIGVATTCLSETIGDDVPMFLKEYMACDGGEGGPPVIHVSTPSYRGTHMDGFHDAVLALVSALAETGDTEKDPASVNIFPGMVSCEDLRHLKEIVGDFGMSGTLLPDYSDTLDGPLWTEYRRIPKGGTTVEAIRATGRASATLELGRVLAGEKSTAGKYLETDKKIRLFSLGLPIGVTETDRFLTAIRDASCRDIPEKYLDQRGRLLDALVDGHKYVSGVRAVLYGEEDLVAGLASFMGEIGVQPVLCASGGGSGRFESAIRAVYPQFEAHGVQVLEKADFSDIEVLAEELSPDLIIGHGKGYKISRKLNIPLVRVGFPVHDRFGGQRLLHVGYQGAIRLFDRIVNAIIEKKQSDSPVGYTYI